MNEVERIIFKSSDKWFFLKSFFFDRENNFIKIQIFPNDNIQMITSFLFQEVVCLNVHSEKEEFESEFPKQIIGIDYDSKKHFFIINCGEVEYSFIAQSFQQIPD